MKTAANPNCAPGPFRLFAAGALAMLALIKLLALSGVSYAAIMTVRSYIDAAALIAFCACSFTYAAWCRPCKQVLTGVLLLTIGITCGTIFAGPIVLGPLGLLPPT